MMAVAMEVGWRGSELGSPSYTHMKHKSPPAPSSSWGGADPQKVLQLMMGQVHESRPTLDLFGNASSEPSSDENRPDEFVELDPDLPPPSGWEKCLDLKSGKVYYVNRHTGAETHSDPGKQSVPDVQSSLSLASSLPQTRDFFGTKESENEKLGDLTVCRSPSFSGRDRDECRPSLLSSGNEPWQLQWMGQNLRPGASVPQESGLELQLDLHAKGQQHSVCTLEKVEMALMRTEKMLGKRVARNNSASQSDHSHAHNHSVARASPSPSTSSSSTSTSSRPSLVSYQLLDKENQNSNKRPAAEHEGDSHKETREMVMVGGCQRCLTYVMLSKSDPVCPRCGTPCSVGDFSMPASFKRPKMESEQRE